MLLTSRRGLSRRTKGSIAGTVGNFTEWYDFAVFGASAPVLTSVFTSGGSNALTGLFTAFAAAFVLRPVGALVIGRRADLLGRRGPLVLVIVIMCAATTAIGLLPTYAAVGATAFVLLMALRAVQGFSTGGEWVASITYVVESAPPGRRGRWGGAHMATIGAGFAAGIGVVTGLVQLIGQRNMESWGWRLPFLLALPLGAVGLYLRLRSDESPEFVESASTPIDTARLKLYVRRHRSAIACGFVITAAWTCSFNLWFVYLPSNIVDRYGGQLTSTLACALCGMLALAVSAVACGHLSDLKGRRPLLLVGVVSLAILWIVGPPLATNGSVAALAGINILMGLALGAVVLQSALPDLLPVRGRALGLAFSVGLGTALVGGTAPLLAQNLPPASTAPVQIYAAAWAVLAAGAVVWRMPRSPVGSNRDLPLRSSEKD